MNGMGGDDRMYGEKGRDTLNGGPVTTKCMAARTRTPSTAAKATT